MAAAVVGTVVLGALLRAFLAGSGWLPGGFAELRHAHTHLGWYGVVLPAAIALWSERRAGLGRWYGAATAAATLGFVVQGYGPVAIAASTVVLGFWLWRAFLLLRSRRAVGWLAPAPWAVLAAALLIPGVAFTLRRDPALSQALVSGFLAALLLGVALPAAARRGGLAAPSGRMLTAAVLGSAAYLGPLPIALPLAAGPLLLGLLLLRACVGPGRTDLRLLLAAVGVGLLGAGSGLLPWSRPVAIAGIHFALLGPVLHGLLLDDPRSRLARASIGSHHALLVVMAAAIATNRAVVAAATGGLLAAWWLVWAVARTRSQRGRPGGTNSAAAALG